jgi:ubiquinone/menaquinone biosynthesis C-methylase UbiE
LFDGPLINEKLTWSLQEILHDLARLKLARKNHPGRAYKEGIAEKIPFDDASFDVVVLFWTLWTCLDVKAALNEMGRVLKPNGTVSYLVSSSIHQYFEKIETCGHPVDYFDSKVVKSHVFETFFYHNTHTFSPNGSMLTFSESLMSFRSKREIISSVEQQSGSLKGTVIPIIS